MIAMFVYTLKDIVNAFVIMAIIAVTIVAILCIWIPDKIREIKKIWINRRRK